jgi:hypothetical protein
MSTKCNCGGEFKYASSDHKIKASTRMLSVGNSYFSGTRLLCDECNQPPEKSRVIKDIKIEDAEFIYTKSEFAVKIGVSPQSIDTMIKTGRLKVSVIAKKEFVYYDK